MRRNPVMETFYRDLLCTSIEENSEPSPIFVKNMVVVTGRDFRANTAKYVDVAYRGEDVVVKSRAGSFRIVPISKDDIVINKRDLTEELRGALLEAKESIEGKRKLNTLDNLINELRNSND